MDEFEFQRILNLFQSFVPAIIMVGQKNFAWNGRTGVGKECSYLSKFCFGTCSQDKADSISSRQSTAQPAQNEEPWDGANEREITIQEVEQHDAFWGKLKMAAEKKDEFFVVAGWTIQFLMVGAAEAERFCKAFQTIHKKLVYEELSLDAARSFLSSSRSSDE